MMAVVGVIAALAASEFDTFLLNLRHFALFQESNELVVGAYFLIILVIVFGSIWLIYFLRSLIWGKRVKLEMRLSTMPGRKGFGRYLVVYFRNVSNDDLKFFIARLINITALDEENEWKPKEDMIVRKDYFLWGTQMVRYLAQERAGWKDISKNHFEEAVIDLLHTDDKKKKGKVRLTQQYLGEAINMPIGSYRMDVEFTGVHLGQRFYIPLNIQFKFDGGMSLSEIKPRGVIDRRIVSLSLFQDGMETQF
ncbi:MAG: hypothetical protein JXB38_04895 [Anaerolineales bacterium]|nr:hypothetical protein [Anaerolineales bacterium]